MPNDFYPQMRSSDGGGPGAPEPAAKPDKPGDGESADTALIPKSLLGGKEFKVGEEVVLKIVHLYEDEVEVEYAPAKPQSDDGRAAEMSANNELDQMAAKNERM